MVAKRSPRIPQMINGPLAARPDASTLPDWFYYQTYEGELYYVVNGVWNLSNKLATDRATALEAHETFAMHGDPQKALARWKIGLANARAGNGMATMSLYGDSIIEGFYCSSTAYRMSDILRRRIAYRGFKNSADMGNAVFLPAVSGNGAGGNWPGAYDPWTRTGVTTNYDSNVGGPSMTLVNLNAGAKMVVSIVCDQFVVSYTKGPAYPNSAALQVKVDGVIKASINPFNAAVSYNNISATITPDGGYALHTVEIENVGASAISLEGLFVFQQVATGGGVAMYNYGNGGSYAGQWAGVGGSSAPVGGWDTILTINQPHVIVINLGTNDATFGSTPAVFETQMKLMIDKFEAKLGTLTAPRPGYIFTFWPSSNMVPRADWWAAFKNLVAYVPDGRAIAIDMMAELADVSPAAGTYARSALLGDGVHPTGDAGQNWFADVLERLLDPTPPPARIRHTQLLGDNVGGGIVPVFHYLGTKRVRVTVTREATGEIVTVRTLAPDPDYIQLDFDGYARVANEFRVTVS